MSAAIDLSVEDLPKLPAPLRRLPDARGALPPGLLDLAAKVEVARAAAGEARARAEQLYADTALREALEADRAARLAAAKSGKRLIGQPSVDALHGQRNQAWLDASAAIELLEEAQHELVDACAAAARAGDAPGLALLAEVDGEIAAHCAAVAPLIRRRQSLAAALAWLGQVNVTPAQCWAPGEAVVRACDLPGCSGLGFAARDVWLSLPALVEAVPRLLPPTSPQK